MAAPATNDNRPDRKLLWPAVDFFTRVIREPSFPAQAVDRERARALIGIRQAEQSPSRVAGKTFMHLVYGKHPYAMSALEDPVAVKALRWQDLLAFHRRYYVGKNALIVIVGDASRRTAERLAKTIVGKLPSGRAAPALPAVRPLSRGVTKRISFPSTQTYIFTGQPGIRRHDPDFFPLYVGNHILGGGSFTSRLFDIVREKNGLSYSIYSHFQPQQQTGVYYMYLQTSIASRQRALQLTWQTLMTYFRQGPTEQELVAAKKYLTGNYPLTMDNSGKIAGKLAMIGFYRLPLNYLDEVTARINAVTLQQIRDAYHRHLQPDKFVTVIVGG